jgi:hypothetical protein
MSDNAGLVLYRKFGESVVIDNHITLTPTYLLASFKVGKQVYDIAPIQEWNNLENAIPVSDGWFWVLDGKGWREDYVTLKLKSSIQLGNAEFEGSGIEMLCYVGQPVDYPNAMSIMPMPQLIAPCCVVELVCQDTDQNIELTLVQGVPQEVFFAGLKAKVILDSFRGSYGPVLRIVAPPQHSIVRSELLERKREGR